MKPERVLQVVTIMNRGGLETMLMNYYRQIDRNEIQFDFMVHRADRGHYDDEIERLGGKIYRMMPIRPGCYMKYFKMLDEFFAFHPEYKVVHSHINENSSFVLRAAKRAGVPCRIAHSHLSNLGIDFKLPFRWYARYSMKDNPNEFFACSKRASEWLFGNTISKSGKVVVLNNAVNVNEFKFDDSVRNEIRSMLGAQNKMVIGHVGRFNTQKNHRFLIDVFKAVNRKNPNTLLVMIGDGDLLPAIKKKVSDLELVSAVKFLGVRGDIPKLMQAMDVFLFPSLFEGLPVVMIEAQAAGLRCIVSDSITRESDLTGRVEFISLNDTPEVWANKILSSSFAHEDTSEMMRKSGYDTLMMSKWLTEFYLSRAT